MIERRTENCSQELVVQLDKRLCFEDFGQVVISLLEDILYRTCHIDQPVRCLSLLQDKLSPTNRSHLDRLQTILRSIEKLAATGELTEVVLLQGSTVPLAQRATHIFLQANQWDDNSVSHQNAIKQSKLNLFRAVASLDNQISSRSAKCFLFVRVANSDQIDGFERRPALPANRAKSTTVFRLRQRDDDIEVSEEQEDNETMKQEKKPEGNNNRQGTWLQLNQHLPTVSIS